MSKLSADEARDMLLAIPVACRVERAVLKDSLGRVLAEDVAAVINVPPFDRSPYDGYAIRGEDTLHASPEEPAVLKITEEIPAGAVPTVAITKGFAAKILTGASIPDGANATVKFEDTQFTSTEVRIFSPVKPGSNIVKAGEDILVGAPIAGKGEVITPPHVGMFAGQGICDVAVFARPRVAILNTGTELMESGQRLLPGKIYNSNGYTLSGYLADAGVLPYNAGTVEDDAELIASRIDQLLNDYDMVVTTGGASVGDYDWAVRSAQLLGAEVLFWKCAMKPGGSMMAAVKGGKLILGLSGNPGAAVMGLLKVGMPFVRKLTGRSKTLPEEFDALMAEPYKKKSTVARFICGHLVVREGAAYFSQTEGSGNGLVSPLLTCDLIGQIPEGTPYLNAGDRIRVFRV